MFSKKPASPTRPAVQANPVAGSNSSSTFSVIGADVKIKGDVEASADLHVDGAIEGDIKCSSLVQGETSAISGSVVAETAQGQRFDPRARTRCVAQRADSRRCAV